MAAPPPRLRSERSQLVRVEVARGAEVVREVAAVRIEGLGKTTSELSSNR